jgi:hypothetical protein
MQALFDVWLLSQLCEFVWDFLEFSASLHNIQDVDMNHIELWISINTPLVKFALLKEHFRKFVYGSHNYDLRVW